MLSNKPHGVNASVFWLLSHQGSGFNYNKEHIKGGEFFNYSMSLI